MANTHIGTNINTLYGQLLRNHLTNFQLGNDGLANILASMVLMINGDGTQDAHYTDMTAKFGFASDALSHAAYNELNALYGKLSVDTSVTLVKTQITQTLSKFR